MSSDPGMARCTKILKQRLKFTPSEYIAGYTVPTSERSRVAVLQDLGILSAKFEHIAVFLVSRLNQAPGIAGSAISAPVALLQKTSECTPSFVPHGIGSSTRACEATCIPQERPTRFEEVNHYKHKTPGMREGNQYSPTDSSKLRWSSASPSEIDFDQLSRRLAPEPDASRDSKNWKEARMTAFGNWLLWRPVIQRDLEIRDTSLPKC